MEAIKLLHNYLLKACPDMHSSRRVSLLYAVESGLNNQQLTLTSLGRTGSGTIKVKNKIKKIDRLLGNKQLYKETDHIHRHIAATFIGDKLHPIILVDWSAVDERDKFQVLKATLAYQGRSITILDHVELTSRPKTVKNNSHDRFLKRLKSILPDKCKPIIVTDAGFTANWFRRIEKLGWYFVGRIRGLSKMRKIGKQTWETCNEIYLRAINKPFFLGEYELSKKKPINCQLFIHKKPKIGRIARNKNGTQMKGVYNPRKAEREPWLLASNLPESKNRVLQIVNSYKYRMQIEETFRDIKTPYYGLGLVKTLSNSKARIEILLLISSLTLFVLGIIGKVGYDLNIHQHFQANTVTNRKVLSLWFLGKQIYRNRNYKIPIKLLIISLRSIVGGILCYQI